MFFSTRPRRCVFFINKKNDQNDCAVRGLWNLLFAKGDAGIDRVTKGEWGFYHARYWFNHFGELLDRFSIEALDKSHVVVFAHGSPQTRSLATIDRKRDIYPPWFLSSGHSFERALLFVCYCDDVFTSPEWRGVFSEWVGFTNEFRLRMTVDEFNRMYRKFFRRVFQISANSSSARAAYKAINEEFEELFSAMAAADVPGHEARVAISFINYDRDRMILHSPLR